MVLYRKELDIFKIFESHHKEVIEEEDLPLVDSGPLRSVGVRDFVELAATDQPTVWEGQNLLGFFFFFQIVQTSDEQFFF